MSLQRTSFQPTPQTTVRDFLDKFYLTSRNLAPSTQSDYRLQVSILERFWRTEEPTVPLTIGNLSDELIYAAMNWQLSKEREATTANKLRRSINTIWRSAKKVTGTIPDNHRYRENVRDPIALLPDQLDKLLAAAGERGGMIGDVPAGQWWVTAILFVYSLGADQRSLPRTDGESGPRPGRSADRKRRRESRRRDQRLDLFPGVIYWLRELRLKERGVERVLGDSPWKIRTLRDHYTELFVDAGLYTKVADVPRNLKFHALRKTLASQLFAAGGMPAACERMGHSSTQVTERYIDPRYKRQTRVSELVKDPSPARLATPTLKIFKADAQSA